MKATKHTITTKDLVFPIEIEQELAGSYGNGSNKALILKAYILHEHARPVASFVIRNNGENGYTYATLEKAIEGYNELP